MGLPRRQMQPFTRRWSGKRPPLWSVLVALNVVCFILQVTFERIHPGSVLDRFALSVDGIRAGQYWQFFTYMFLHQGPVHLIVNMMVLLFAAREVESIVGPKQLSGIYFCGGLLGGIAQFLISPPAHGLVGASGGVCAVLIAFTTILPEVEITMLLFFVLPVRMRAKYLAYGLVGMSVAFALVGGTSGGYGHYAHLGGSLLGWLYARQLGFGNPLRFQRYMIEKRQREERYARMTSTQFISEEIDPILDKISQHGIHSLSRTERRVLEKGRDKIAKRTGARR
ncbi:MAG: rhomboid family intramembrane serine protease [Verrucomicrobiota bacterium]|nr:rhomboid family intramembrane serine protease [Verrucomicrobiota bacterium]